MQETNPPAATQLQNQLTTRLPLLWFSLAFIAGIVIASFTPWPTKVWITFGGIFIALTLLVSLLFKRLIRPLSVIFHPFIFILLTAIAFGALRYQVAQSKITPFYIAFYNDRDYDLLVTGSLTELPDYRDSYTNLRLQVEAVDTGDGDMPVSGLILVRVPSNQIYHYGERVRLRGKLQTPPENEDFSYRDYLARDGIHSYMSKTEATVLPGRRGNFFNAAMYAIKERSLANIYRLFPDPEASLLAGILLGVDTGLTGKLQDAFKNTGTSHIIAISGFNISIIAGIFVTIFSRMLGPRRGAVVAIAGITFYTLLVGADAAVVRAAIMGGFALFARQVGRRNLGLNTLAIVALIMAVINPLVLWDVGFQLSFFATLGLILYAEPFSAFTLNIITYFTHADLAQKIIQPLSDFVLLTFAAQVTTMPLMAYYFKRISLVSFIANPFILPVQPAVMIVSGLAVIASLVNFPLGQLIGWSAWPFAAYTIHAVEFFDRVPNGSIYLGDSSLWLMLLFYGALFALTFSWSRLKEWFSAQTVRIQAAAFITTLALLFILTIITWRAAYTTSDGQMHVTFIDVGSANAILIQTPSGRNVLVNGGASATELSDELGRRLPLFNRKLDWLVIASTDEEQISSLPRVVERYTPLNVLWGGNVQASYSARLLDEYFAAKEIPVTRAETGQRLDLGDGAFIEVKSEGPRGSVLLIEWQDFRALLPIGVGEGTLEDLEYGNAIGKVDVLLLADSGFAKTNPLDWIQNLNPQLVVLSVSAGDPYGMPAQETLDNLEGYSFLRTDRNGWISVSTDGTKMQVDVEKGAVTIPTVAFPTPIISTATPTAGP